MELHRQQRRAVTGRFQDRHAARGDRRLVRELVLRRSGDSLEHSLGVGAARADERVQVGQQDLRGTHHCEQLARVGRHLRVADLDAHQRICLLLERLCCVREAKRLPPVWREIVRDELRAANFPLNLPCRDEQQPRERIRRGTAGGEDAMRTQINADLKDFPGGGTGRRGRRGLHRRRLGLLRHRRPGFAPTWGE